MNILHSGPALSAADIEVFEQEIAGRLPDDYKQFLLKSNGGWNNPPLGLNYHGETRKVPDFRSLLKTDETGLRRALRNIKELGIDGFLPITSTQNGEDVCLDFRQKVGAVWLFDYLYENDVPVDARMFHLADSFTEFLRSLDEMPEPYCRIEELGKHGTESDLQAYLDEGKSINATGKNDMTIVQEAIKFANLPMIEACITRKADLSKTIHQAVISDRPDLVKRLAEAGVDVNETDEYGDPPMFYVGGIALPGEEGARNRAMHDLLIHLGAK